MRGKRWDLKMGVSWDPANECTAWRHLSARRWPLSSAYYWAIFVCEWDGSGTRRHGEASNIKHSSLCAPVPMDL
jgi:hypothetical protein